ncbi:YSIRK-type signal peptide-containing protein, partial [Staphylococcus sp. HMSC065E08]
MRKRKNHFDFLPNIRNKYSIRKFSVGTASIIVSSLFFLGYSHEASASTENINPDTTVLSSDHQTSDSAPQNAQPAQGSIEETPKTATADEKNPNLTSANLNATGTTTNPTQNSNTIQEDKTDTSNKVENSSDNPDNALKTIDSTKPAVPAQDNTQPKPQKEVTADTNNTESSTIQEQDTHQNVEADNNQSQSSNEAAINNPAPKPDVTVSTPQPQTPDLTSQSSKLSTSSTNATDEMIGPDPTIQTNVNKASDLPALSKEQVNNINHQITWLDFSDTNAISNYGQSDTGQMALQVGTKYEKEIMPGLVVTATVKSLQPFESTPIYERRAEGDADSGYNPKATNIVRKDAHDDEIDKPAYVVVTKQDPNWSHLKKAGVDTGEGLTNFGSNRNYGNVGATFEVKTTYNGREVPANIVMSDGEEAKNIEALIYTTNGSGWELFANVKNEGNPENYHPITADDGYFIDSIDKGEHGKGKYYVSPDKNFGGLGTQIFGPNQTRQDHNSVPIVVTTGATEVSFFVNSTGIQTVQMGFVILDKGDAPASYGEAIHAITENTNVSQPFLGTQKADIDFDELNKQAIAWQTDDINTPTSAKAADEGEQQLVGANQNYVVYNAANQTYALDIIANTGDNDTSYVRGWGDYNHNGVFDSNEASELVSLSRTGDEGKKITLLFHNAPQVTDTSLNYLGVRVRTSLAEDSVNLPNGVAYSGEVEDFEIKVIHPPRGEKSETTGLQGQTQTSKAIFNAFGRVDKEWPKKNTIDTVKAIQIVDTDGKLVSSLTVPNEGQYDVTPDGTITFTPDPQFKGTAKGIVLRATDLNGNTSGWTSNTDENNLENINQGINGKTTMDAVYIPTVTPVTPTAEPAETTGLQGQPQIGTPVFKGGNPLVPINETIAPQLIDPNTGSKVSKLAIPDEGTYIANNDGTITFTPEPQFTGKASPITVERVDTNGTAVQTTYTPNVTPVTPVGTPVTSEGPQGQPQEGTPTFEGGNPLVPIDENTAPKLIDPNTGNEVDKVIVPDEGT